MRPIEFEGETIADYERTKKLEWIVTNGLGGYSSSTITGLNSRGYHGLLVAALEPPLKRTLLLTKLEEEVITHQKTLQLSVNKYPSTLYPEGHLNLKRFSFFGFPIFTYKFDETTLTKSVQMKQGENLTIIVYELTRGPDVELRVRPLVNCRDFHGRTYEAQGWPFKQTLSRFLRIDAYEGAPPLYLSAENARYVESGAWYRNLTYDLESERGETANEDHYSPGTFTASLKVNERFIIRASAEPVSTQEESRYERIPAETRQRIGLSRIRRMEEQLLHASQQFLVKRRNAMSIIAGYHWFADYGRDAMISIPGLTLVTRRFEDAKLVIRGFLDARWRGLIPAFFTEDGANYASVDSSLWMIYAAYEYLLYTRDREFPATIYDGMKDLIEHYVSGTEYGIRVDSDALLDVQADGIPLTWMDVIIDDAPVISRRGKVVEVNALWYNALSSMEDISSRLGNKNDAVRFSREAARVKRSFNRVFWNDEGGYLYDSVSQGIADPSVRPNQIFAISLPFEVLYRSRWNSVLSVVRRHLLTPYGLRTLSPQDPKYVGRCDGDRRSRDRAYHQGTVWAWLIGPYVDSFCKIHGDLTPQTANSILGKFEQHLLEAGIGTISEIFDGDSPHQPRGCISQAWSVAEILRAILEHFPSRS